MLYRTNRGSHSPRVRVLVTICVAMLAFVASTNAQEQERKLIDRILKPDTALQNPLQQKQFSARGSTTMKQARTKDFYVRDRRAEKEFRTSAFLTKDFRTTRSRYQNSQASLATRTKVAKADAVYPTAAYRNIAAARDAKKAVAVSDYTGTRPFLIQGKSQKALSQQDRPLTIDEVRELLNKNK